MRERQTAAALAVAAVTLLVVVTTLTVASLAGRPVARPLALHVVVLAALGAVAWRAHRTRDTDARTLVVATSIVAVMFFLYSSLGHVAFVAIPWDGDGPLRAADRWLGLGTEPAVWVGDALARHPWTTEALSAFYGLFIPYLYLTIFLGLVGRAPTARRVFVLAFALLYGASFMGYLFVPARGPVVSMVEAYTVPLQPGFFHGVIASSIDAMGGPHGAFPSLHVGASFLAMTFDLRHGDRLRGLVYVPLVALICVATVALRYHYVIDVLAGVLLGLGALSLSIRWHARTSDAAGNGRSTA